MLLAPCDSRLSNWSCFSAHSWTKSFSSSSSVLSLLVHGWRRCTGRRRWGWCRHWAIFAELEGFWQRVSTRGRRRWAGISSIIKHGSILVDIVQILLHITCLIISELKHPRYCFPKFVSIWPSPEVVDGIFEVCPSATKFCPLVNKPVALGFSLWWRIFDIYKQFCPLLLHFVLSCWSIKRWTSGACGGRGSGVQAHPSHPPPAPPYGPESS